MITQQEFQNPIDLVIAELISKRFQEPKIYNYFTQRQEQTFYHQVENH